MNIFVKEINIELIKLYEFKNSINEQTIIDIIKNIKSREFNESYNNFLISFINDPLVINNFNKDKQDFISHIFLHLLKNINIKLNGIPDKKK